MDVLFKVSPENGGGQGGEFQSLIASHVIFKVSHIWAMLLTSSKIAMMQADAVFFTSFVSSIKKCPDLENIVLNS